jgi:hypothetical protein
MNKITASGVLDIGDREINYRNCARELTFFIKKNTELTIK